ncbi:MAG: hypothetical protein PHV13_04725 [Candidatus ainarchaeum sp.]|nr:hypothetical protein [Candidatus ainarchaeum sp.]
MQTQKLAHGKERHFPVKRYVAWSATAAAAIALPFLLRTCGPKVEPMQEPILLIAPHGCGKCAPDTTRFKGQNGAPDTIIIDASSQKEQGCDSTKDNFNSDCGCKKAVKKAKKVAVPEAAPVMQGCAQCNDVLMKPDSRGGRIMSAFEGRIANKGGGLTNTYGNGNRVDVTVNLDITREGLITAQYFTLTGAGFSKEVDLGPILGMNVVGRQVDAPMNGCCTLRKTYPAP